MTGLWPAIREGGPWAALFVFALLGIAGLMFAMSRGILIRGAEVDRMERQREKDTERVLNLYLKQLDTALAAAAKKDETIATQLHQIGELIHANNTSASALEKILKEAERRGFLDT